MVNLTATTAAPQSQIAASWEAWWPWIQYGELALAIFLVVFLHAVYTQPDWIVHVLHTRFPFAIWHAKTKLPVASLTIDDAPSDNTPLILDILKENNVKATFFIIKGNTIGREHILQRIVDEGHVLGNHFVRDEASIKDPLDVFESKLLACHDTLSTYQSRTRWARPGSGWFNKGMEQVAEKHGYRFAMGSVYPHDAQIRISKVNEWHLRLLTRPGSVIIVHDRPWSVAVLKNALPHITKKLKFVSLEEMEEIHARGDLPVAADTKSDEADVSATAIDSERQSLLEK
ncbi:Aste57867_23051 [Aphanomyces stellatus]|uniref:Aste57867_23051 protein n=1 Tax=Aphanomyces stellatus TaxID=120398 RepID=A0A485LLP8_9STRA|nr:hypothetical protein As57867_022980 [Aphanomyces stellatus]VFT99699.1 Aste57867_23051 [Aphanomyces stellatus]